MPLYYIVLVVLVAGGFSVVCGFSSFGLQDATRVHIIVKKTFLECIPDRRRRLSQEAPFGMSTLDLVRLPNM